MEEKQRDGGFGLIFGTSVFFLAWRSVFAIGGIFYSEYMEDEYPPTELEQKELKDAFNKVGKFVGLGPHPEDPPPEARPEAVPAA